MTDIIFDDDLLEELFKDDDGKENSASHVAATPQHQTHPPGATYQHQASGSFSGSAAPAYKYCGSAVYATGSGANAVQTGVNVNMQGRPYQARAPAQHCAERTVGGRYNCNISSRHGDCRPPVQNCTNGTSLVPYTATSTPAWQNQVIQCSANTRKYSVGSNFRPKVEGVRTTQAVPAAKSPWPSTQAAASFQRNSMNHNPNGWQTATFQPSSRPQAIQQSAPNNAFNSSVPANVNMAHPRLSGVFACPLPQTKRCPPSCNSSRPIHFRKFMRTVWHNRAHGGIWCSNGWSDASTTAAASSTASKSAKHRINHVRQTLCRPFYHPSSEQCICE